jgi:hypothetical protein
MQKTLILSVVLLFVSLFSCHKRIEEINKVYKFGWAKAGNKLYYDYYTTTDTLEDYRYLSIYSFNSKTSCREEIPNYDTTSLSSNTLFFYYILNRDFVIKEDGLYEIGCEDCGFLGCSGAFEFLYAPNIPDLYQELPLFSCSLRSRSSNIVIATDSTVTVPMGTFKTYVLEHSNGDKSFWSPDSGIIMYEVVNGNNKGTFKLNRIVR